MSPAAPDVLADPAVGVATPRSWHRLWVYLGGLTVSMVGDRVWFVALAWAATRAGDAAATSLVLAAGTVPRAVVMLLGGAVADRLGARRVMLASDSARAVLMAAAGLGALAVEPGVAALVVLAAVLGAVDALYHPASRMVPRALVDPADLPRATGAAMFGQRLGDLAGAPLGGLLVASGGFALACLVDAGSFLVVLVTVLAVRVSRTPPRDPGTGSPGDRSRPGVLRDLVDGLGYVWHEPLLRALLLFATTLNLLGLPIANVGALLRADEAGWGVGAFAAFSAAFAGGAAVGSLAVARLRPPRRPGVVASWWAVVQAVAMVGIGWAPTLAGYLVSAVLAGVTSGPVSAYVLGHVQAAADERYLGRVMSLVGFSAYGVLPVAYGAFGLLAGATSTVTASVGCAVLMLVPCALALASPTIRAARGAPTLR